MALAALAAVAASPLNNRAQLGQYLTLQADRVTRVTSEPFDSRGQKIQDTTQSKRAVLA